MRPSVAGCNAAVPRSVAKLHTRSCSRRLLSVATPLAPVAPRLRLGSELGPHRALDAGTMTLRLRPLQPALLVTFLLASMGADAEGCSAELESDGNAEDWAFGEIPEPAEEPLPMTCEFVEEDNCWKQLVAEMQSCLPAERGTFVDDRTACEYPDGSRLEWDGSVNVPDSGIHIPYIEHRVLDSEGEPCVTTKFLGIAHAAFDIGGDVTVLHADSLTTFQLTCSDGTTYRNDVEGACPDLGAQWLAQELPGYDVVCDGEDSHCQILVNGSGLAETPRATMTTCEY